MKAKKKPVGRPKLPDHLVKKKRYIRLSDLDMIVLDAHGCTLQEMVDGQVDKLTIGLHQYKKSIKARV
jgi:hypothetical protein